uniref:Uncharacterized protein n=1 Tax=Schistosoma haematobium TaxID=6185 RepID=A0A094ZZT6_SCHHA
MALRPISRRASTIVRLLHRCSSSTSPTVAGGIKDRMLKFITSNHNLFDTGSPHDHHLKCLVLYRNLPARCFCGHWFLLVDGQRYEEEREKKWNKIRDEPGNAGLLKRFDILEKELNILLADGKSMTPKSPGAAEMMDNMALKWKEMKEVYANIRKNMLLD